MKFRDPLPPGTRTFESRARVQWADVDAANIMYFGAYFRYVELAEIEMFEALGHPHDVTLDRDGVLLARVHVEADYHAPALMSDRLRMRTHVEHVGRSSVRYCTVVFNERTGEAGATARFTLACMEFATRRGRPLPDAMRAALLACVGAAP